MDISSWRGNEILGGVSRCGDGWCVLRGEMRHRARVALPTKAAVGSIFRPGKVLFLPPVLQGYDDDDEALERG